VFLGTLRAKCVRDAFRGLLREISRRRNEFQRTHALPIAPTAHDEQFVVRDEMIGER